MEKVLPSWIIIFVGYVVASVTSPVFGMEGLGRILFWSGFTGYLALLPLLVYRTVVIRKIAEPFVPTVAIFAAPVNLCVVGCLTVYGTPPEIVVTILAVLGTISYIAVVGYLPVMLNRKFYPTFSALTFPLVISAVSFYVLGNHYGFSSDIFWALQAVTVVIAAAVVVYVLIRYIIFLYQAARSSSA
jgi:exfoliative toxin A/B